MQRTSLGKSFTYLNISQFLSAFNDNVFKLLIIFSLIFIQGTAHSQTIVALAGIVFVTPFILLILFAGHLADKYSKKKIIVYAKALELLAMLAGIAAFFLQDPLFLYTTLFFMATHSVIFSPAKYGIIPEIVVPNLVLKANSWITSFTYFAVIIGTFTASLLADLSNRNYVLSGTFCALIALIGLITSFNIQPTPPAHSTHRLKLFFPAELFQLLRHTTHIPFLFTSVVASSFFLFFGAYIQLMIVPLSIESLRLTEIAAGYLFLMTAFGIGCGGYIVGHFFNSHANLKVSRIGSWGIALLFLAIYFCAESLPLLITILFLIGVCGGIYLIPIDTYIQIASPTHTRGKNIAATTFLSFFGIGCASIFIWIGDQLLHLSAKESFLIIGIFASLLSLLFSFTVRDFKYDSNSPKKF